MMPDEAKAVLLDAVTRATDENLQAMIDAAAAGKVLSGGYYNSDWSMRCPLCILATGVDNGEQETQLEAFYDEESQPSGLWNGHYSFYTWFDDLAYHRKQKPEAVAAVLEVVAAEQQRRKERTVA